MVTAIGVLFLTEINLAEKTTTYIRFFITNIKNIIGFLTNSLIVHHKKSFFAFILLLTWKNKDLIMENGCPHGPN